MLPSNSNPLGRANTTLLGKKDSIVKQAPGNPLKKSNTQPGEKKPSAPKSPGVKKQKEIVFVKLFVVQQQYKHTERNINEIPDYEIAKPTVDENLENDENKSDEEQRPNGDEAEDNNEKPEAEDEP